MGRRMGGSKATVELCGRPLIAYPLAALTATLKNVAIIAKPDTELPDLPGVTVWIEPNTPSHPLVGIVQALALADDRSVLACAADMPFVTPGLLERIVTADPRGAPAVVYSCDGRLQPFPGLYLPRAATPLGAAVLAGDARLSDEVAALSPRVLEHDEPHAFFNVNAPEDLLQAAALFDRRSYPNVKT
jgi:molybdopterin-guanine dinucleotide biosynthesis protein A